MKKKSGITISREFSCGFCIYTDSQDVVEANAKDSSIELTDEVWERINNDLDQIERNIMDGMNKKYGIEFRDEGHSGDCELIGTCRLGGLDYPLSNWFDGGKPVRLELTKKQAKTYKLMMEVDDEDVNNMLTSYNGDLPKVYYKCSAVTKRIVDVYMYFFNVDEKERDIYDEEIEAIEQDGRE